MRRKLTDDEIEEALLEQARKEVVNYQIRKEYTLEWIVLKRFKELRQIEMRWNQELEDRCL